MPSSCFCERGTRLTTALRWMSGWCFWRSRRLFMWWWAMTVDAFASTASWLPRMKVYLVAVFELPVGEAVADDAFVCHIAGEFVEHPVLKGFAELRRAGPQHASPSQMVHHARHRRSRTCATSARCLWVVCCKRAASGPSGCLPRWCSSS